MIQKTEDILKAHVGQKLTPELREHIVKQVVTNLVEQERLMRHTHIEITQGAEPQEIIANVTITRQKPESN